METAAIFLAGLDEARVLEALQKSALVDGPVERTDGFAYFRLPPPERVAFRDELAALTGGLEPEPAAHWVTHPFECWLAGASSAPAGKHRPHPVLPVDMVDTTGTAIAPGAGVEVRTLPANAPYLLLALAHAGLPRPLLQILD